MSTLRLQPGAIRELLGLSRSDWARALNVSVATVRRWEDDGQDPGGVTIAVLRGISEALDDGADPTRVGRALNMGVGTLLYNGIIHKARAK